MENCGFCQSLVEEAEELARKLTEKCCERAQEILREEKLLFLKVAEFLSVHSRMDKKVFIELYNKYSVAKNIDFNKGEVYFSYKDRLKEEILKK